MRLGRFIYAKPSENKAKVHPKQEVGRLEKVHWAGAGMGVQNLKLLLGSAEMGWPVLEHWVKCH
jgi:hypothetical protein